MRKALLSLSLVAGLSASAQMNIQGDASLMIGGCDCYQLTPDAIAQVGAIWSPSTIDMTVYQELNFQIYIGDANGDGDGMVFVLQTAGSGIGTVGNSIGYDGILNSVGVEIDSYGNVPAIPTEIWADHIAITNEGSNNHLYSGPVTTGEIEDGSFHDLQIVWDPAFNTLGVFLDATFITSYTGDIITDHFGGATDIYFGFTSSTGGATSDHQVCMYRNADFTPSVTTVCPQVDVDFTDNSTSDLGDVNITDWDWDFGDGGVSTDQNPTYAWTTEGTYTVTLTITDASGCTATTTQDITVLPPLDIDSAFANVECFGDSTGWAAAIPMSGTAPYTYQWDDYASQTTDTAFTLPAGTYNCTVTDDLGCTGTTMVTITENPEITITGTTSPDSGGGDGSIDITAGGGTPGAGGYTYSWSPGGSTDEDPTGLAMGTYTVTVTDSLGCSDTASFFVGTHQSLPEAHANGIQIFPNPAVDALNIRAEGEFGVVLTDLSGKIVYTTYGTNQKVMDLGKLERGMYLLTITVGEDRYLEKIMLK